MTKTTCTRLVGREEEGSAKSQNEICTFLSYYYLFKSKRLALSSNWFIYDIALFIISFRKFSQEKARVEKIELPVSH